MFKALKSCIFKKMDIFLNIAILSDTYHLKEMHPRWIKEDRKVLFQWHLKWVIIISSLYHNLSVKTLLFTCMLKIKGRKCSEGKDIPKRVHKLFLQDAKYDWKQRYRERLEFRFKLCNFRYYNILHCSKCPRLYGYQDFFQVLL